MRAVFQPIISVVAVSLVALFPLASQAKKVTDLTIVNHFDQSLSYAIGINPELLPDLPKEFTLATGEQKGSKLSDLNKEAYIRVDGGNGHSAFWGVELVGNKVKFHGYISKGIAYSWNEQTIVFCTPDEYKPKKSCF